MNSQRTRVHESISNREKEEIETRPRRIHRRLLLQTQNDAHLRQTNISLTHTHTHTLIFEKGVHVAQSLS